ncbi:AAA family ATPase [Candidatus Accumulibacter cognatus]|mgnify:CR=1 FL=1|uniref:AAA family ATPase n=1 Tax=Candidatus Accumulibacter cognatus TaxID=2954383 RepID=A0A080M4X6_9PROT|nr:AAA family ATPase [Candidatus Accumulibacter cognatus]KFB76076.1 MAG: hypothetical protein AW06_002873 [Candidatus Accumulibacter cognatus]QLH52023.1 MAG: AAA family ATPase [Candidatus Accumulibacter cognatus]
MLHEDSSEEQPDGYLFDRDLLYQQPVDTERWKALVDRTIDEISGAVTLKDIARAINIEVEKLSLWLTSMASFLTFGRRVGEKSVSEKIADGLEKYFLDLDSSSPNTAMRCKTRVKTSVIMAMIEGIETARSMCEFVEICAAPGLGKTESIQEYIASTRKVEGFNCPVWLVELDETCISPKTILQLIAREIVPEGHYEPKSEFSMMQAICAAAEGLGGVVLIDEGQHLADVQKIMGIPTVNLLRRFVDRRLFGIAYFGNGEIYRRLTSGTGKNKDAYTQLLSRMQDFRVEILSFGKSDGTLPALTREDVLTVAAAWGVTGVEERAYCLKAAAQPGALRNLSNIFRLSLERYGHIDISAMNKIRRF